MKNEVKNKAKELLKAFKTLKDKDKSYYVLPISDDAKQCSMILIDEIIDSDSLFSDGIVVLIEAKTGKQLKNTCKMSFWKAVRIEIIQS